MIPVSNVIAPDNARETSPSPPVQTEPTTTKKPSGPAHAAIDDLQRDAIRNQVAARLQAKKYLQKVRKRLLSISGKQATIDEHFPYNDALLERGQTWSSLETTVISGPDVNTQRSVAMLWQKRSAYYSIAAGYALDAAGTWRKHVWLLAQYRVQEVTLKHAVYYGVQLSEKESKEFVRTVLGG